MSAKSNSHEVVVGHLNRGVPSQIQAQDEVRTVLQKADRVEGLSRLFSKINREVQRHEHKVLRIHHEGIEEAFRAVVKTRLEGLKEDCNHWLTKKRIELNSDLNRTVRSFVLQEQEHLETAWNGQADGFVVALRKDYDDLQQNSHIPRIRDFIETRIERKLEGFLKFEQKLRDNFEQQVDRILERQI